MCADCLLVVFGAVGDLLLSAKHLFLSALAVFVVCLRYFAVSSSWFVRGYLVLPRDVLLWRGH